MSTDHHNSIARFPTDSAQCTCSATHGKTRYK